MWRKLFGLLMAAVLLCSPLAVAAETVTLSNDLVQPALDYTATCSVSMRLADGTAHCSTIVEGYPDLCKRIEITMTLQKKVLFWWSTVESWEGAVNDGSIGFTQAASIGSGTFRVKSDVVVYGSSANESFTVCSQEDSI